MDQLLERSQEIPAVSVELEVSDNNISGISGLRREPDRAEPPVRPSSDGRKDQISSGVSVVARDSQVRDPPPQLGTRRPRVDMPHH
jgi:hypothetical protein